MTPEQRRPEANEDGAALAFALVFVVAIGMVLGALVSLSGTNLIATVNLQNQRNLEFAADAAVDGAIQAMRFEAPTPLPPATSYTCPTYPAAGSFTVNGATIMVQCTMSIPSGFRGRLVEFDACTNPVATFAQCQPAAVLRAEVVYNDVSSSGCYSGNTSCTSPTWGTGGMTLESWTVESANG